MATKLTLFTRFLKGWAFAPGGIVPDGAAKAYDIETENGLGWKLTPVVIAPPVDPEPEPEPDPEPEAP